MTTAVPSKSLDTTARLALLQAVAASTRVVGSEIDVSGKWYGLAYIHFARTQTSAAAAGVTYRFEACPVTTGTLGSNTASQWYVIGSYTTGIVAISDDVPSASSGAALTVASVTGFAAQDVCFVSVNAAAPTLANSEWFRVLSAASTTITAEENFKNTTIYSSGVVYDQAEIVTVPLDLSGVSRLRLVIDGLAHDKTFVTEVYLVSLDAVVST